MLQVTHPFSHLWPFEGKFYSHVLLALSILKWYKSRLILLSLVLIMSFIVLQRRSGL